MKYLFKVTSPTLVISSTTSTNPLQFRVWRYTTSTKYCIDFFFQMTLICPTNQLIQIFAATTFMAREMWAAVNTRPNPVQCAPANRVGSMEDNPCVRASVPGTTINAKRKVSILRETHWQKISTWVHKIDCTLNTMYLPFFKSAKYCIDILFFRLTLISLTIF